MEYKKLSVLFLTAIFCISLLYPINSCSEVSKIKTVTLIPYIANKMDLLAIGETVFNNQEKFVDVDELNMEKKLVSELVIQLKNKKNIEVSNIVKRDDNLLKLTSAIIDETDAYTKIKSLEFNEAVKDFKSDYLIIFSTRPGRVPAMGHFSIHDFGYFSVPQTTRSYRDIFRPSCYMFLKISIFDLKNHLYLDSFPGSFRAIFTANKILSEQEKNAIFEYATQEETSKTIIDQYKKLIYGPDINSDKGREELFKYYEKQNFSNDQFSENMHHLEQITYPIFTLPKTYDQLSDSEKELLKTNVIELVTPTVNDLMKNMNLNLPKNY